MNIFLISFLLICQAGLLYGQDGIEKEFRKIIQAPESSSDWPAWRDQLINVRDSMKKAVNYTDTYYKDPAFHWAATCYNVNMLMMFDQTFYNPETNEYMVEKYIKKAISDFGGFDGVVLWHAYPRIGIDERNQFDFYRDMPGGLDGLRNVVERFHKLGVKVFINYNPWDTGTRREDKSDINILMDILKAINADGIFLDTLNELEDGFRNKLNKIKPGIVLESELELPTERIFDHHMSWAQWFEDSHVPGVLWNKWFERRHMLHQIKRWNESHIDEIHTAWMNGSGMLVWENVFGTMVMWNEFEKSILRSIFPIQHSYNHIFTGEGWIPLVNTSRKNVYANHWFNDEINLWTLINRDTVAQEGPVLSVSHKKGISYYDLITGKKIIPVVSKKKAEISLLMAPSGIGCILAIESKNVNPKFESFLKQQANIHDNFSKNRSSPIVNEHLISIDKKPSSLSKLPEGMAVIDKFPESMSIQYMMRECGFYHHEGYISPPSNIHKIRRYVKPVNFTPYAIDETPVTNKQFYKFIQSTGYSPEIKTNFLKHWENGKPPMGKKDHPVVYVSMEDARAYANWANKRLPTEEEWQLATQGIEGFKYPWGNDYDSLLYNSGQTGGTSAVKAFPGGKSPFGCYDMCGNTWEWTESERSDGYTRYIILKGGSYFDAETSMWYTQGRAQPSDMSLKFIMMYPGLDRCATIGFRCVVDLE